MKSDLFIECAKSVVDFYNLTQESIGSKNRMEYPVVKEVKPRRIKAIFDSEGIIIDYSGDIIRSENIEFIEVTE